MGKDIFDRLKNMVDVNKLKFDSEDKNKKDSRLMITYKYILSFLYAISENNFILQ
jgi:hypothetical protein